MAEPYDARFFVALWPRLVVHAGRYGADTNEVRIYYVRPELGIEHSSLIGEIRRLTAFGRAEIRSTQP